jgi:predicted dienelactone hydrolase
MVLPPPTGPFPVGSVAHRLTDTTRPAHLKSAAAGRKLFLKLWYPAQALSSGTPERLWDQLRDPSRTPLLVRAALRPLQRRSASYPNAPLASDLPTTPIVLYTHGLISFASENTSLMQELASREHVVIAIEHEDQLLEFRALNSEQPRQDKERGRALRAKWRCANPTERAALAPKLYENSNSTDRIVLDRAQDARFVLDHLTSVLEAIPGSAARLVDTLAVHLVGYSVGGAVATRVAADEGRIASVTNIDGGLYGTPDAMSLRVPYLMVYSAGNEGINDALLPPHATKLTAPKTAHLNFHDIAGMLPLLRWVRALGPTEPVAVLAWRSRVVADFIGQMPTARSSSPTLACGL